MEKFSPIIEANKAISIMSCVTKDHPGFSHAVTSAKKSFKLKYVTISYVMYLIK